MTRVTNMSDRKKLGMLPEHVKSLEDLKFPIKKLRKKNRFQRALSQFFGCVSKNVEKNEISSVSVSCQCQIENDLLANTPPHLKEINVPPETRRPPTSTEYSPLSEEFKSSLKKLDSLINTLNNIHDVYKSSNSYQFSNESPEPDKENVTELEEDGLKFNINFNKDTFIECQTRKGKRSLRIVHSSRTDEKNLTPLILHRCESEFLLKTASYENLNLKSSSEVFHERNDQLQRSYHTFSGRFGSSAKYDFSLFKKNLIDQTLTIKNNVRTLRNIICYVECLSKEKRFTPMGFTEMKRWFLGPNDMRYEEEKILQTTRCRYIEARTRATNFCKFYTMEKKHKEKSKSKIVTIKRNNN